MRRVRLKADGRLVEVMADGQEHAIHAAMGVLPEIDAPSIAAEFPATVGHGVRTSRGDAAYAKAIRAKTGLTQAMFAERIGVPIETVRNWEQGKRAPRGPARALLKLIQHAPEVAFSVLGSRAARD